MVKKLLIVEDDESIRMGLRILLGAEGYTIVEAQHGAEALRQLGLHPDVDLILLDLSMSVMDGDEFLERRNSIPNLKVIPVLIMTASAAKMEYYQHKNVLGCVRKPFELEELIAAVEKSLRR